MSDEPDRRAWSVIAKMHAELKRQSIAGGITNNVQFPDTLGRVFVNGHVDLASLAHVTEQALAEAFAELEHADPA